MESFPEWLIPLGELGFPAGIAIYLLIRFEKRIEHLTEAIRELEQSTKKTK